MDTLMERLADSPRLAFYKREIDRLLAAEDGRRRKFREEIDASMKAEFINGQVVMHSPARAAHLDATWNIANLLGNYVRKHRLGVIYVEKALIGLTRNDYEPDVCFFPAERAAVFTAETNVFPAPALVVEVLSESTERRDRGVKLEDYAAHGIAEYWIVDPETGAVEQHILDKGGGYGAPLRMEAGTLRSLAVAGFAVPVRAFFDAAENHAALSILLAPAEDGR